MMGFQNITVFRSAISAVAHSYNLLLEARKQGRHNREIPHYWYIAPISDIHFNKTNLKYRGGL